MNDAIRTLYVRPRGEEFEVLPANHRRGPCFATEELAIEHASSRAVEVAVLDRTGKVVREMTVGRLESVPFCGCTNTELEAGVTCGRAECPNRPR